MAERHPPGLVAAAIAPHTPFLIDEAATPPRLHGVLAGCRELGRLIRDLAPDVLVINSSHWNAPFLWYVATAARHRGRCISDKDNHPIAARDYDYPGDPAFAQALVAALTAVGLPASAAAPGPSWDYGLLVPARFIDPDGHLPIVPLSSCLMATLDECRGVGRLIGDTAVRSGRRVAFIASTSFAHRLETNPETAPPPETLAADLSFIGLLREGRLAAARERLPAYAAQVHAELAGRTLATFLGCFDESHTPVLAHALGDYGHSSGSGNFTLAVTPRAA